MRESADPGVCADPGSGRSRDLRRGGNGASRARRGVEKTAARSDWIAIAMMFVLCGAGCFPDLL